IAQPKAKRSQVRAFVLATIAAASFLMSPHLLPDSSEICTGVRAMSATHPFVLNSAAKNGKKLRVLMAESEPPRVSKMLRSLFPDEESALQLTMVSTISILLPTIQLVGPEVLFLDLSTSGQDALATVRAVHRAAPSLPLITLATAAE